MDEVLDERKKKKCEDKKKMKAKSVKKQMVFNIAIMI